MDFLRNLHFFFYRYKTFLPVLFLRLYLLLANTCLYDDSFGWLMPTQAVGQLLDRSLCACSSYSSLYLHVSSLDSFFFISVLFSISPHTPLPTIPSLIKSLVSGSTLHQSLPHLHTSICLIHTHTRCMTNPADRFSSFAVYRSVNQLTLSCVLSARLHYLCIQQYEFIK